MLKVLGSNRLPVPALPLTVALGKGLDLSPKPQFPHLEKGDNYRTHLLGRLQGLNTMPHVKCSVQCPAQNKLSILIILLMTLSLQILQLMYLKVATYCFMPMKNAKGLL